MALTVSPSLAPHCRPEWGEASIRDGRWVLPFLVSKNSWVCGLNSICQVHPGGTPPLVVVFQGDLEARWVEEIVDVDLVRLEIGRRRARMQVLFRE